MDGSITRIAPAQRDGNRTPEEFARGWMATARLPLTPGEQKKKHNTGVDIQVSNAAILMPVGLS